MEHVNMPEEINLPVGRGRSPSFFRADVEERHIGFGMFDIVARLPPSYGAGLANDDL